MAEVLEQEYELVDVDRLQPHPDNPRLGDVDAIRESIRCNDFFGACLSQRSTSRVIAGWHRYQAACEEGLPQVPVLWVDVDDAQASAMALADNGTSDRATYDTAKLRRALQKLPTMTGTGWDKDRLRDAVLAERDRARNGAVPTTKVTTPEDLPPAPHAVPGIKYAVLIVIDTEEEQIKLFQEMQAKGYTDVRPVAI